MPEEIDPQSTPSETSPTPSDDFFLTVNDRTRYKTQEEAVEAFGQAGERISQLAPYERVAQEYGISDPEQIADFLEERNQLIERIEEMQRQAQAAPKAAAAPADDEELSQEEKNARKWLEKNGVKAGYVKASDLEEMRKQIEDLRGGAEESKQEQFQQLRATRMEQGRTLLAAELKEMKLPADGDFASMIEDSLASYINADERRTNAFFAGGEALKQVIKEGLARVKTGLGLYDQSRTSNYTQQKQAAIKRTPSPLPKPGAGKGNAAPTKEKLSQSDIHNRAWEAAQRAWGGQTQE